jgi:lipopolysaccharide transport system permease protein
MERSYTRQIWATRYFWTHLVGADLRAKYRRSSLGLLWSVIHPLALTAILSLVMSRVFGSPILEYAPFIFSGLIWWEFVIATIMTGCHAFINSEGYIRQFPHPLVIYSLRSTLSALVNLGLGVIGLLVWVAIWRPGNLLAAIPLLPVALLCYFAIGWPIATLAAFFGTRYRDLPQFLVIALQAIWYLSPVFFEPKLFRSAGVGFLVDWNPIYYLLDIIRAPFLEGGPPAWTTWIWFVSTFALVSLWALRTVRKSERTLIFHL